MWHEGCVVVSVVAVVQARYGSSNLPGKVLQPLAGTPMLTGILARLERARSVDVVVVATTESAEDDPVAGVAADSGVDVYRGAVYDVLDRIRGAVKMVPDATTVVRVSADCPFVDPMLVDEVVAALDDAGADVATNRLPPPYLRTYPEGLDVEACTVAALDAAWLEAKSPQHREHTLSYLYDNPDRFRVAVVELQDDLSRYRWTVDSMQDLAVAQALADRLVPGSYDWTQVLAVAQQLPELASVNTGVRQKVMWRVDERWLTA